MFSNYIFLSTLLSSPFSSLTPPFLSFYHFKNEGSPLWFLYFNLFFLVSGAFSNTLNFIYAFTRSSPLQRKLSDILQLALYIGLLSFSVLTVVPLEMKASEIYTKKASSFADVDVEALSTDLLHAHMGGLGLQMCQLAAAFWGFYTQNPKPKKD